jgi:hypothetical protein
VQVISTLQKYTVSTTGVESISVASCICRYDRLRLLRHGPTHVEAGKNRSIYHYYSLALSTDGLQKTNPISTRNFLIFNFKYHDFVIETDGKAISEYTSWENISIGN